MLVKDEFDYIYDKEKVAFLRNEANEMGEQNCQIFQNIMLKNPSIPYNRELFSSIQHQGFAHGIIYALRELGLID